MRYFITALTRFDDFAGRSRRKEFWYFLLFSFIISEILGVIDYLLGFDTIKGLGGSGLLLLIFRVLILLPFVTVSVRRIHDINKSGWYIFLPVYNLVMFCIKGTKGDNRFGPDPSNTRIIDYEQRNIIYNRHR